MSRTGNRPPEAPPEDPDVRESRRILERVRRETEPQVGAAVDRIAQSGLGHFRASDVDPTDRIEVIGTRIGRALGLVVFAVLVYWLATSLAG